MYPPIELMVDCEKPLLRDPTWQGSVDLNLRQDTAIDNCNLDKSALRKWRGDKSE